MKTYALLRLFAATLVVALLWPAGAAAQSAATQYQRVLARETAVRKQRAPSISTLRSIATAYEAIPRRYPTSGYSDNALWQAAGVLELAYGRSRSAADRTNAIRLLQWLKKEYPSSSLKRRADTKLSALAAPAARPARPAAGVAAAAPAAAPAVVSKVPAAAPVTAAAPTVEDTVPSVAIAPSDLPRPSGPAATIRRISREPLPKGERITFELSHEPLYSNERSAAPDRLTVDIANAIATPAVAGELSGARGALIRSAALSRSSPASTKLVLELTDRPRYSIFTLYNPYRLVVDIERDVPEAMIGPAPATTPRAAASGPAPPSATASHPVPAAMPSARGSGSPAGADRAVPTPAAPEPPAAATAAKDNAPAASIPTPVAPAISSRGDYSLARQLGLGVARIVIDPGHGGHDPGAVANGVNEAELVLDVAKRVEQILLGQPGVEVVLTRRTNQFIPLEERTGIANREGADLFLSIHANSSPRAAARGVETFFLNFASNPEAEAVAARENASGAKTMRQMPSLLQAIALNSKLDESREFASLVQNSLVRRLQLRDKAVRDLGIKQAPFVVLIGAGMPSVLAEISFVSNRTEASLLKQSAYRQRIAQGLADGVLRYQASLKKVGSVATNADQR